MVWGWAALALATGARLGADDLAARVIIFANAREPESVRLAEFYAAQRGVPPANIVSLPLPEAETITWREFIDQVYQPLQDELYHRGWLEGTATSLVDKLGRKRYGFTGHRLSYLVTCRGVPLRIFNDPTLLPEKPPPRIPAQFNKNEAAVDSELSLLAQSGYEITATVNNPLFSAENPSELDAEMVVKVCRLDGPSFDAARQLVTSALAGEATGLIGRSYLDLGGPVAEGDRWLRSVENQLADLGFDGDVERTEAAFAATSRFDAPVLYFGWYAGNLNGPFARDGFMFPPGAIAVHIHSFSAHTLRSATEGWCGPLVARGVAATVGNVFEPYLELTHRPNLLLNALGRGRNFGDAAYYALPVLSWEAVAIGDPLYCPFKVSLEAQEANRASLTPLQAGYVAMRRANLLARQGHKAEALALLRDELLANPSLPLGLAVARHALASEDPKTAVNALKFVALLKQFRPEDWALAREAAGILAAHDDRQSALQIYQVLSLTAAPGLDARKALLKDARDTAAAAGDQQLSAEFGRKLAELTAPEPPPK
ncbi:MAG TPA: TIGR03790 family protein [Lacunisphaera sp.]|nr:TIGR03790 family protein [Lacunisphaera sp.]